MSKKLYLSMEIDPYEAERRFHEQFIPKHGEIEKLPLHGMYGSHGLSAEEPERTEQPVKTALASTISHVLGTTDVQAHRAMLTEWALLDVNKALRNPFDDMYDGNIATAGRNPWENLTVEAFMKHIEPKRDFTWQQQQFFNVFENSIFNRTINP